MTVCQTGKNSQDVKVNQRATKMMKEKHGLQVKILKMFKMSIPCGSCFFAYLKTEKLSSLKSHL